MGEWIAMRWVWHIAGGREREREWKSKWTWNRHHDACAFFYIMQTTFVTCCPPLRPSPRRYVLYAREWDEIKMFKILPFPDWFEDLPISYVPDCFIYPFIYPIHTSTHTLTHALDDFSHLIPHRSSPKPCNCSLPHLKSKAGPTCAPFSLASWPLINIYIWTNTHTFILSLFRFLSLARSLMNIKGTDVAQLAAMRGIPFKHWEYCVYVCLLAVNQSWSFSLRKYRAQSCWKNSNGTVDFTRKNMKCFYLTYIN